MQESENGGGCLSAMPPGRQVAEESDRASDISLLTSGILSTVDGHRRYVSTPSQGSVSSSCCRTARKRLQISRKYQSQCIAWSGITGGGDLVLSSQAGRRATNSRVEAARLGCRACNNGLPGALHAHVGYIVVRFECFALLVHPQTPAGVGTQVVDVANHPPHLALPAGCGPVSARKQVSYTLETCVC